MNPLSLTHQDFCETIQEGLSRGKAHASLLYREWWRSGTLLGNDPAFANAQGLLKEIQTLVSTAPPLALVKDQGESDARKLIFRTQNNLEIESVLIQMKGGSTLCVSSQVGCKMACAFCETGRMGLLKNLTAAEICAQFWMVRHQLKAKVRNVVFMGMGEPFDNYDEVLKAVEILSDPFGGGVGPRRITISTVGRVDGILRLMEENRQVNLAVSLNAPNDLLRNKLMPINRNFALGQLLETIALYNQKTGRQVLVAYVLMAGVNDSLTHAGELARLLQGLNVKINLIPYNAQSRDRFQTPEEETIKSFRLYLESQGYPVLLRKTKGAGQMSACGQLGNVGLRRQIKSDLVK